MTEPTDDELDELRQADGGKLNFVTLREFRTIARAVLAKWGTPPAVAGEPVAWEATVPGYIKYVTQSRCEKFSAIAKSGYKPYKCSNCATPQPAQAQAGAVESAEFGQFLSDVLTAAGLVTHGKQCKALGERLADMCVKLRHHGIKGGQHGAE